MNTYVILKKNMLKNDTHCVHLNFQAFAKIPLPNNILQVLPPPKILLIEIQWFLTNINNLQSKNKNGVKSLNTMVVRWWKKSVTPAHYSQP